VRTCERANGPSHVLKDLANHASCSALFDETPH